MSHQSNSSEKVHTPLPWTLLVTVDDSEPRGKYAEYKIEPNVAHVFYTNKTGEANAELILRAVNNHADLLAALKKCAAVCAGETMSKSGLIDALESARTAIQRAT